MKLNINYYLNSKTSKANIIISVHFKDNRIKYSTGLQIEPKFWDFNSKRPKKGYRYEQQINRFLDGIRSELQDFFYNNLAIIDMNLVKNKVRQLLNKQAGGDIIQHFDLFIDSLWQSKRLQDNSVKRYITCRNHLAEYMNDNNSNSYSIFTSALPEDFVNYLINKKSITNGTAIRNFKYLKTFVLWSLKNGYCQVNIELLTLKDSNMKKENSRAIALTIEELNMIENYTPDSETLTKVKSMFLLQCYTGLRYSDLANLHKSDVNFKTRELKVTTIKTDVPVIVPLHDRLRDLLKIYDYDPISNQKYNEYLKYLANYAGLNEEIKVINYYGIKRIEEIKKKWQLVTSHTGRRTFVTLMIKSGVINRMVMEITGHKSEASMKLYVNIVQQEALKQVKNAWDK